MLPKKHQIPFNITPFLSRSEEHNIKRVLILAYDFPPYVSVGALRPYNWYKYFKEFNIEPVVITRQWENKHGNHLDYISESEHPKTITIETEYGTELRTPYQPNVSNKLLLKYGDRNFRLFRKAYSGILEVLQYMFPMGTKKAIYIEAEKYLKNNKIDLIIATGEPFVLFKYASKLSREFNIPWIADYRDPWTLGLSSEKKILTKLIFRYFEKKIVKTAMVITTVDEFFKTKLEEYFPNKRILVFPNGYDPEIVEQLHGIEQGRKELRISFVGTIYKWHPYKSILNVLDNYLQQNTNDNIKLVFYGTNINEEIKDLVKTKYRFLSKNIEIHDKIPNRELMNKLASDNVMLLFNYYSFTGTKIYDYIGLKRKILFCYTEDEESLNLKELHYFKNQNFEFSVSPQIEIIKWTNSGIMVKNSEHLYTIIGDLYQEFIQNGFISCDSVNSEFYSRKIQVQRRAELINELLSQSTDHAK